jgi:hypothetical protein
MAGDHAHVVCGGFLSEVTHKGGLADTSLTSEQDEPALAVNGRRTLVTQERTLPRSPVERYLRFLNCALPPMVKAADGR